MAKILYIYNLLSRKKRSHRIAFFLPWIGIFVGTTMLLLINGIMRGMEDEIFWSLNKIDKGYKFDELHITSTVSMEKGSTGEDSDTIRTPIWLINGKHLLNKTGKKLFTKKNLVRVRIKKGVPHYY